MYLIVGLGNPEAKYDDTRHNVGFKVIDEILSKSGIILDKKKFDGMYTKVKLGEEDVVILKPTTYMNLSGRSVKQVIEFFKIDTKKIIVIYDDVDIEVGKMRIKKNGSSGMHNGIKSLIECLGTTEFMRIRVGIGKPKYDMVDHVLGKFEKEEIEIIDEISKNAANAAKCIMQNSIDVAMNKYN